MLALLQSKLILNEMANRTQVISNCNFHLDSPSIPLIILKSWHCSWVALLPTCQSELSTLKALSSPGVHLYWLNMSRKDRMLIQAERFSSDSPTCPAWSLIPYSTPSCPNSCLLATIFLAEDSRMELFNGTQFTQCSAFHPSSRWTDCFSLIKIRWAGDKLKDLPCQGTALPLGW